MSPFLPLSDSQNTVHLPRLVLIADRFTEEKVAEHAITASHAGVPWVHLRDHEADDDLFREAAASLTRRLREAGARVTINTRLDVARTLEAGLHVGARGPGTAAARAALGAHATIGFSAHDLADLTTTANAHVDYFFLSPIFPTGSKPGHPGLGLDVLHRAAAATRRPVFALGGTTPERVGPCRRAGAHGIAVLSGILHADDPDEATRRYLHILSNPQSALRDPS